MEFIVRNNHSERRFEAKIENSLAFVEYKLEGNQMTLVHTEVPPELGGQGVGSKIVKAVLDFAKGNGLRVLPECPFVKSYIERHENYQEIVKK